MIKKILEHFKLKKTKLEKKLEKDILQLELRLKYSDKENDFLHKTIKDLNLELDKKTLIINELLIKLSNK